MQTVEETASCAISIHSSFVTIRDLRAEFESTALGQFIGIAERDLLSNLQQPCNRPP
jgi:hypothetical protein